MKKRLKKKAHKKFIDDVAYEISIDSQWRKAIFNLINGQDMLITKDSALDLPPYIETYFYKYNLQYTVCIVESCPEKFDDELIVFKFTPKLFPEVKRYSGNNPMVI